MKKLLTDWRKHLTEEIIKEELQKELQLNEAKKVETLRRGSRNKEAVKQLQQKLIQLGHMTMADVGGGKDFGIYGGKTFRAVKDFQKKAFPGKWREHDGVAGENTLGALGLLPGVAAKPTAKPAPTAKPVPTAKAEKLTWWIWDHTTNAPQKDQSGKTMILPTSDLASLKQGSPHALVSQPSRQCRGRRSGRISKCRKRWMTIAQAAHKFAGVPLAPGEEADAPVIQHRRFKGLPIWIAGDMKFLVTQLELTSYINNREMHKIHNIIKKYVKGGKLDKLKKFYHQVTKDDLAKDIVGIHGTERWKKPTIEMFGIKYEKDITTKITDVADYIKGWLSDLFEGSTKQRAIEKLSYAARKDSYLLWDGDELHWVAQGKIVESWEGTSGKLWFVPSSLRGQRGKSFGPIPETKHRGKKRPYKTGGLESIKRNIGDPSWVEEAEYFIREMLAHFFNIGTPAPHGFYQKKGKDVVFSQIAWGQHRIRIIGRALGRGGFFIHGGTLRGSSGCIDLGEKMPEFAKFWTINTFRRRRGPKLYVEYTGERLAELKSSKSDTSADRVARKKRRNIKRKT